MSQPDPTSPHNSTRLSRSISRPISPPPRNATEIPLRPYYSQSNTENEQPMNGSGSQMPKYDKAHGTKLCCVAATCLGMILSVMCITYGCCIIKRNPAAQTISLLLSPRLNQKVISGAMNIIVTLCIAGMGFAHSVSLRWALYHEDRLAYNTNLRLFTCSKTSSPNRWYGNFAWVIGMALSYGSLSNVLVLFMAEEPLPQKQLAGLERRAEVNGIALTILGFALGLQAIISMWCLASCRHSILTWSSNPLNTTLAIIQNGNITRRPRRCLLSVHQQHQWSNQFVYPTQRQGNIMDALYATRYIILTLWSLPIFAITLTIANITTFYLTNENHSECWRFDLKWALDDMPCSRNIAFLDLLRHTGNKAPSALILPRTLLHILLLSLVQGGQAIALHCMELIVNVSRDESIWQQAYNHGATHSATGARLFANPFKEAISSPSNVLLLIAKIVLPWTLSQGLFNRISSSTSQNLVSYTGLVLGVAYSRLIVYTGLSISCCIFATYLAIRRPRSYQPSSLGHLQTLADLIDDWETDGSGRLWWGDKTRDSDIYDNVRYAGTSSRKELLSSICSSGEYR